MGLMDRLLGKGGAGGSRAASAAAQGPQSTLGSPQSVRKELARLAVREALLHSGIPATWIRADPLTTASPGRETGVHVRLVVQHWDARLMLHAVPLQDTIEKRIQALDPEAGQWLMGLSWQFALDDASACPPLPHPGSWTAPSAPAAAQGQEPDARPDAAAHGQPEGAGRRAELERLMSARDAQFRAEEETGDGFGKTQPMPFEKTQPITALEKTQVMERTQGFQKTRPMQPEPSPAAGDDKTRPTARPDQG
ncbi:hypothetical protein PE066_18285 [Ramlibacter tataouinensis]|uniref:hypothetical protein n=1 Tax=Ramlibacter tataouinensis TaxID=94132 RepID=UPI0022F3BD1E|nr:hypothetical protein [Ramlibacter tataouinensis]WBY01390.1 hypothetical protein PE066_18285 [Ramlibacter tataouinensis]